MKAVVQRVAYATVSVDGQVVSRIGRGLMVLFCVEPDDTEAEMSWFAAKCVKMRLFPDSEGVMNLSVKDVDGEIMVVSQFTLAGNIRKGNRPSYIGAAGPDKAVPFYDRFCEMVSTELGKPVAKGVFGADMKVELLNDGPVTIVWP